MIITLDLRLFFSHFLRHPSLFVLWDSFIGGSTRCSRISSPAEDNFIFSGAIKGCAVSIDWFANSDALKCKE